MRASTPCGARARPLVCRGAGGRRGSTEVRSGAARPPIDDDATAARPGHRDGPSVGRRLGRTGRRRSVIDPDARMIWPPGDVSAACRAAHIHQASILSYVQRPRFANSGLLAPETWTLTSGRSSRASSTAAAGFRRHCCVTRSLVVLDRGRRRGHSDYELEFVECGRQPEHRRDLDSEFVVAAT